MWGELIRFQIHMVTSRNTSLPRSGTKLGMMAYTDTCAAGNAQHRSEVTETPYRKNLRMPLARICTVMAAGALSACAVGPDYREPQLPVPPTWQSQPANGFINEGPDSATLASWWKSFDDPALNQLIERAIDDNRSVRQAIARVKEARARRRITAAGFLPTLSASAAASRSDSEREATSSGFGDTDTLTDSFDASLDAGWEIDLFGGQRRSLESSTAQLVATEAELRDALIVLLGDVALSYVDVRTTQARLSFAERNLASQREVLDIAGWRTDAGLATVLDVEQAKASYAQTQAQIPSLESAVSAALNRLAVLTGQRPGALQDDLGVRKPLPVVPVEFVSSVPAEVMRRRPDIRSAERRLAAQTAEVGVATAALYPSLTLSGSIGVQASSSNDLINNGLQSNRYGVSLNVPIFRGGALRQNINAQNALVEDALAGYEAVVLGVYEEVENGLTQWVNEQVRRAALRDAASSARIARDLALAQYNSGLVDFQTVLTADRQLISTEDALAVSDGEVASNLIRLYKAFGGGWSVFPASSTAAAGTP